MIKRIKETIVRFLICVFVLFFVIQSLPLTAQESLAKKGQYITLTGDQWNVRAVASLDATVLISAYPGSTFKVLDIIKGDNNDYWYKVNIFNKDAYISASPNFTISDTYVDKINSFDENIANNAISDKFDDKDEEKLDDEFELSIAEFPESYKVHLRSLHKEFPRWAFVPYHVNSSFQDAISIEASEEARNLVANNANYPDTISFMKSQKIYDGGGYAPASQEAIAYFMDPRNFLNKIDIFQFESMNASNNQSLDGVKKLFAGNNDLLDIAEDLFNICQELNLNPYTMASRIKLEVGLGDRVTGIAKGEIDPKYLPIHPNETSLSFMSAEDRLKAIDRYEKQLAYRSSALPAKYRYMKDILDGKQTGKISAPEKRFYNVANIGAYPNVGTVDGAAINALYYAMGYNTGLREDEKAYFELPWDSQSKAVRGAVKWIAEQYINEGQNTVYFQKWDVVGASPRFWHQYMGSLLATIVEAKTQYQAYLESSILDSEIQFLIPIYAEMPEERSPNPVVIPEVTKDKGNTKPSASVDLKLA